MRGDYADLQNAPLNDGFAYFTPDNGHFYIDVARSTEPAIPYEKSGVVNGQTIYRIELRPSAADGVELADKATADSLNQSIVDTYIKDLSYDYNTNILTMYKGGGGVSTISIPPRIQIKTWTSADFNN